MEEIKITVRLSKRLHVALVQVAEEDQRSLNSEITWLLGTAIAERIDR